ncbi:Glutaredoxin [Ectocarpus siliculosus]|uniref:Glutaredoxin n=1 Tax=Ectocarpus siliculosus TaxID=2880 RepID=D7G070_ECTSI|nr:Glutaredoxin [Ectocarpus siliculosus]|eukprot:CBJ32952.1 Glutaredoxin [Ectocarpus siliculosus]
MAASYSAARQGLLRALARSPKLGSPLPATPIRSLTSVQVPALQQQLQLRRETLSKSSQAWSVEPQQQMQQRRRFAAASGGDEDGSDDDFKPKRKAVPEGADEVSDLIKKQVESNPVMLYMKGTPAQPQCGFSKQVVSILHSQGVSFSSVNVLDYPPLREGIKTFSEWPTIPQLYVKGEFVGGCDILTQLHQSGDLETMLKEAKLKD